MVIIELYFCLFDKIQAKTFLVETKGGSGEGDYLFQPSSMASLCQTGYDIDLTGLCCNGHGCCHMTGVEWWKETTGEKEGGRKDWSKEEYDWTVDGWQKGLPPKRCPHKKSETEQIKDLNEVCKSGYENNRGLCCNGHGCCYFIGQGMQEWWKNELTGGVVTWRERNAGEKRGEAIDNWASLGWKNGPAPDICPPKPYPKTLPNDKKNCSNTMKYNPNTGSCCRKEGEEKECYCHPLVDKDAGVWAIGHAVDACEKSDKEKKVRSDRMLPKYAGCREGYEKDLTGLCCNGHGCCNFIGSSKQEWWKKTIGGRESRTKDWWKEEADWASRGW